MKDLIHLKDRSRGLNVYCSNGSAHVKTTDTLSYVTCPICRERIGITKNNKR